MSVMGSNALFPSVHHIQVRTQDLQESINFYAEILGFKFIEKWEHPPITLVDMCLDGIILELGTGFEAPSCQDGQVNHFALNTSDIFEASKMLREYGVEFISPAAEPQIGVKGNRKFYFLLFRGPSGEKIELVQYC